MKSAVKITRYWSQAMLLCLLYLNSHRENLISKVLLMNSTQPRYLVVILYMCMHTSATLQEPVNFNGIMNQ